MGIGFAGQNTTLTRLPGWEANSWAYHGDDGQIYAARDTGKPYREKFGPGDTVGCGINFRTGIAFFTRNGAYLGPAFRDSGIRTTKIYPIIGMKKPNEHITANFGQDPFVFDIIDHMQVTFPNPTNAICMQSADFPRTKSVLFSTRSA